MATPIPENDATFRLSEIAEATGGQLHGADRKVRGVVLDSRRVREGALFLALRGERIDAHRFLPEMAERGAAGVVAESLAPGVPTVLVPDTHVALRRIANLHRRRWGKVVVAITGSAGKTTTRELMAAVLRSAGAVAVTRGNLNNLVGAPMSLLTLRPEHDFAVIELGTSAPGEIRALAGMTEPTLSVVTLVSAAHTEGLGSVEGVLEEKTDLLRGTLEGGACIVNADDDRLALWTERPTYTYGRAGDVRLLDWSLAGPRTVAEIRVDGQWLVLDLGLLGEGAALAGCAAMAVARVLRLDLEEAAAALREVEPVPGRMCPVAVGNALVLDDSYNANPSSMALALQTQARVAGKRRARAVLGDMRELGAEADQAHHDVLTLAESLGIEVVGVGDAMRKAGARAVANADEALALLGGLREHEVLLVKGSHSLGLDAVVRSLATDATARGAGDRAPAVDSTPGSKPGFGPSAMASKATEVELPRGDDALAHLDSLELGALEDASLAASPAPSTGVMELDSADLVVGGGFESDAPRDDPDGTGELVRVDRALSVEVDPLELAVEVAELEDDRETELAEGDIEDAEFAPKEGGKEGEEP